MAPARKGKGKEERESSAVKSKYWLAERDQRLAEKGLEKLKALGVKVKGVNRMALLEHNGVDDGLRHLRLI